jgi:hypothetical protein
MKEEEAQVDFHQRFGKDLISLRLISAKLIEARMLAGDLPAGTQQVLDQAIEHVEAELAGVIQILNEEEEEE